MKTTSRGWVLLMLHGVILALGGAYWLLRGQVFDRSVYEAIVGPTWHVVVTLAPDVMKLVSALVRVAGGLALTCGVMVVALATTSFRRGERWAWYVAWSLPILSTVHLSALFGYGAATASTVWWDGILFVLSFTALVMSPPAEKEPSSRRVTVLGV